jgi:quercetin dioxygenase-like cupin family protein
MYQTIIHSNDVAKVDLGFPGVTMQLLTGDAHGDGLYVMTRMAAGATIPAHSHGAADEFVYVVSGDFVEAGVSHAAGSAFYGVAGTVHGPHTTAGGCVLLTHFSAPLDFIPAA